VVAEAMRAARPSKQAPPPVSTTPFSITSHEAWGVSRFQTA
jgi:hypothetical protein